jgi:hypothetical protein
MLKLLCKVRFRSTSHVNLMYLNGNFNPGAVRLYDTRLPEVTHKFTLPLPPIFAGQ